MSSRVAALTEHGEVVEAHRPALGHRHDVMHGQRLRDPAANALVAIAL